MTHRVTAEYQATLNATVDSVWILLRDWAELLKWWPDDAPFTIVSSEPVGDVKKLPFGRKVTVQGAGASVETLILADNTTHRIYYQLDNGSLPGIANYLASTMVDDLGDGRCRMRFSSMFDTPEDADVEQARGLILSVYHAIARGMERTAPGIK